MNKTIFLVITTILTIQLKAQILNKIPVKTSEGWKYISADSSFSRNVYED